MSPVAKRGPPTSVLSTINWRFSLASHRPADKRPLWVRKPTPGVTLSEHATSASIARTRHHRLADQPNATVETGIADINQSLIGWRVVPFQRRIFIRKTNDHAVVIRGLSDEQFPRSEDDDFASECLDQGARLRGI